MYPRKYFQAKIDLTRLLVLTCRKQAIMVFASHTAGLEKSMSIRDIRDLVTFLVPEEKNKK